MNAFSNIAIALESSIPGRVDNPIHHLQVNRPPWQKEIARKADRYHQIGAWVAIIFNVVFSANDYFVTPNEWFRFFVFRVSVSLITLLVLLLWKKFKFPSAYMIFVPFALICVENAYIWSFLDMANFHTHTLAYIAIYIGAAMLIIWSVWFSIGVVLISLLANVVFLTANSSLSIDEVMTNGGILVGSVAIFSVILLQTRYRLTKSEIIARLKLAETNKVLQAQKVIIEENHRDITDSIRYAEKIQQSILPDLEAIRKHLPDSFVFFKPKDIVSGDFYWFAHHQNTTIIAAVDCTGHGVPGAFMSMLANTLLNQIVNDQNITQPAEILNYLRIGVIESLEQSGSNQTNGGMDMALCTIDHAKQSLEFAGAFNPLLIIRNGEQLLIKGDRMPIGRYGNLSEAAFTNHTVQLEDGDVLYLYSDGFQDQFGGPKNRKYGSPKFRTLLQEIHSQPFQEQAHILEQKLARWQNSVEQIDDIVVVGFRVGE